MSVDLETVCPFCGYRHEAVTGVATDVDYPDDGDVTLCIECGRFCVFERDLDGGLRQPNKKEQRELMRNDTVAKLLKAWQEVRRKQ